MARYSFKRLLTLSLIFGMTILLGGQPIAVDAQAGNPNAYGSDANAPNNAVFVKSGGAVGIGTTNPQQRLHVIANGAAQAAWFESGGNAYVGFRQTGAPELDVNIGSRFQEGGFFIETYNPNSLMAFRVLRDGNIGISTSDPKYRLHVVADSNKAAAMFQSATDYAGIRFRPAGTASDVSANDIYISSIPNGGFGIGTYATPGQNGDWRLAILRDGKVGIGTIEPSTKLEVVGNLKLTGVAGNPGDLLLDNPIYGYSGVALTGSSDGSDTLVVNPVNTFGGGVLIQSHARVANNLVVGGFATFGADLLMNAGAPRGDGGRALVHDGSDTLAINYNGDFAGGVRVDSALSVRGNADTLKLVGADHTYVEFYPDGPQTRKAWIGFGNGSSNDVTIANEVAGADIVLDPSGGNVRVDGTMSASVIQITGGDLAEPFAIANADTIKPGMVVAIDPESPGQMRLATAAYDRTVAGVVSGAGGIDTGVVMYKDGANENTHPVALTGRVYVYADASNGAIQPGDLLTTSATPGHAMKVTEYERAQGAILGKAMSKLEEGTGLVLVLVTLQ